MSAVAAELLKVRTTRAWWGLLLGMMVWLALWALLSGFSAGAEFAPGAAAPAPADDDATARSFYTGAVSAPSFGYVFAMMLGIIILSGEYRHKTITSTLLASPRRPTLVLSKWAVSACYGVLYGLVALATSIGVVVALLSARGLELNLGADGLPRALGLGLLAFVLWGLIGVGIGTLIGNQVVAIVVGILFIIVELIAQIALGFFSWGPDLVKWLPSAATGAMLQPSTETGPGGPVIEVLPWWLALIVLVGYAAVTAGIGAALTLRRDVT